MHGSTLWRLFCLLHCALWIIHCVLWIIHFNRVVFSSSLSSYSLIICWNLYNALVAQDFLYELLIRWLPVVSLCSVPWRAKRHVPACRMALLAQQKGPFHSLKWPLMRYTLIIIKKYYNKESLFIKHDLLIHNAQCKRQNSRHRVLPGMFS